VIFVIVESRRDRLSEQGRHLGATAGVESGEEADGRGVREERFLNGLKFYFETRLALLRHVRGLVHRRKKER
jgi:hypothetical protein